MPAQQLCNSHEEWLLASWTSPFDSATATACHFEDTDPATADYVSGLFRLYKVPSGRLHSSARGPGVMPFTSQSFVRAAPQERCCSQQ